MAKLMRSADCICPDYCTAALATVQLPVLPRRMEALPSFSGKLNFSAPHPIRPPLAAFSFTCRVPVLTPVAVEVNITLRFQLALAARPGRASPR